MIKGLKIIGKILAITLVSIVCLSLLCVGSIWVSGGDRLTPLCDSLGQPIEGALAEKGFTEIGGVRQGYFLRGEKADNPVLLFLHGGPGSPELPMIVRRERAERLEKYFTVCYWDQRGAGMSYHSDEPLQVDQMVEDTRQMAQWLKNRFGVSKIYLVGHSWGSYLGVKVVEKYPELFASYVGIGQVTDQCTSERRAYDTLCRIATERNDQSALEDLAAYDPRAVDFPTNEYLMSARTLLMNRFGVGIFRQGCSMIDLSADYLYFEGYTLGEKVGLVRGMNLGLGLFHEIIHDNLIKTSTQFDVPIYVVQGLWDRQVSYDLAREWFDSIEAPKKEFFAFEASAHSPNIEEPERFALLMRDLAREL